MTSFTLKRDMPYAPEELFAIAAKVEDYATFLPLCGASRVGAKRVDEEGREHFPGELEIRFDKLRIAETFRSRVTADRQRLMVRSISNEPPMKHLDSRWAFRPNGKGGTEVEFAIDFTMSSFVLHGLVTGMLDYALRKVLNAFEARARALYGAASG